ncbi:DUF6516 family protein [Brevundimonas sp.]|jgi:hypothetical protein|uniref:toxin-antitoxin system TumE family protein n=1 Tax=Brevundimonas sp. TaxID=1871086 RepID=UPI0037850162
MVAERLIRVKGAFADGAIVQITVWRLPEPLPPCRHSFKYSLFFGYPGQRLVGFDNERGKGDHWHGPDGETAYTFVSVEALIADFNAQVRAVGGPR